MFIAGGGSGEVRRPSTDLRNPTNHSPGTGCLWRASARQRFLKLQAKMGVSLTSAIHAEMARLGGKN